MHAGGRKSGGGHLREEQFSGVALIQLMSVICVPMFAESSVCANEVHIPLVEVIFLGGLLYGDCEGKHEEFGVLIMAFSFFPPC
jgi:hypothetical protein